MSHAFWTFLLSPVLVSCFALTGCGTPADPKGADVLHVHIFCPESTTCDPQDRLAHFSAFVKDALYRPHSTFQYLAGV